MNATSYDVVVIGGSVVGATAALALRRSGFSVALAERGDSPPTYDSTDYDARVYAISPASASLLERLGVWSRIKSRRASPYRAMHIWVDRPNAGMRCSAADAGRSELGWIVEHRVLVNSLWEAFDRIISVYARAEVEGVENRCSGLSRVDLASGARMDARLLVGADGAESALRRRAHINTAGWQYQQRAIICHVRTAAPHRQTAWQRFLRTGPLAFLPLADGRCSIVWSANAGLANELLALDEAEFCRRAEKAIGGALGGVLEASPRVAIQLRLLHAREYVQPGLALVGDAAHVMHPLAGQGVNLGLADVEALVNTLTATRDTGRDWTSLRTLGRYARSRKAENLKMLAVTDLLCRLFGSPLPGLRPFLAIGMDGVSQFVPIREWLVHRATGI